MKWRCWACRVPSTHQSAEGPGPRRQVSEGRGLGIPWGSIHMLAKSDGEQSRVKNWTISTWSTPASCGSSADRASPAPRASTGDRNFGVTTGRREFPPRATMRALVRRPMSSRASGTRDHATGPVRSSSCRSGLPSWPGDSAHRGLRAHRRYSECRRGRSGRLHGLAVLAPLRLRQLLRQAGR